MNFLNILLNPYPAPIEIDAETYEVRADGELLVCDSAKELLMAQRYFMF